MLQSSRDRWLSLRVYLGLTLLGATTSACFSDADPTAIRIEQGPPPSAGGRANGTSSGGRTAKSSGGAAGSGQGGTTSSGGTEPESEAGAPPVEPSGSCLVAKSAHEYPAMNQVVSGDARPAIEEITVDSIYQQFASQCARCHEGTATGFQITKSNFQTVVDASVVTVITSGMMPQGEKPYAERADGDPLRNLVDLLNLWIQAGRPADVIRRAVAPSADSPYLLTPEVGAALTNIGTCVPESTFPYAWEKKAMRALDDKFEALGPTLTDLPKKLSETDLISLDSGTLARYGVISYAPTYPLWSDDSAKQRYVRVPVGQSIQFDKATQSFQIPPNTRFYKTFLKPVKQLDGNTRYRKIETRLIVVRPDTEIGKTNALFGTYKWRDDESEADLEVLNLRDGKPFQDDEFTYITDEVKAKEIRDTNPLNLTYAFDLAHVTRHYAIPGRERCVQCHMGSPSADFVLGFSPLQVWRRAVGDGGVRDETAGDELTQLERLVALGVITGIHSSDDIVPLEKSQADRKPRNDAELLAQGYLFGNCAHCHNPRGYPPFTAKELRVLNFFPGMVDPVDNSVGGIFQFSLELVSPRIKRGLDGRDVPYITPSLRDMLPYDYNTVADTYDAYRYKFDYVSGPQVPVKFWDAPWRSLIFRNVHTPFTYADDFTIFPHMPLNTAGYDCNARRIIGDWMVSIVARKKNQNLSESFIPPQNIVGTDANQTDNESQPYEEAHPGDEDYDYVARQTAARLEAFHKSPEYVCPDASDIVDPEVDTYVNGSKIVSPQDELAPNDGTPDRTHWVITDLTESTQPWEPRQHSWESILVEHKFPELPSDSNPWVVQAREDVEKVVGILGSTTLSAELKAFALKKFPLGIWKDKGKDCQQQLATQPTADSYTGSARMRWLDVVSPPILPKTPIFENLPGGAIYDMVCVNCHGRGFDAQGRQAQTVQTLTGGEARVANFLTGLFGPTDKPGDNRARIFGGIGQSGITPDDWGARYMAWMALGGTEVPIPQAVLQIVSRTDVTGVPRPAPLLSTVSANMLSAGLAACGEVMPLSERYVDTNKNDVTYLTLDPKGKSPLIYANGDAELWQHLCSIGNRPIVRGYYVSIEKGAIKSAQTGSAHLYHPEKYPSADTVGDHLGHIVHGLDRATNYFPWCIEPPFTQPDPDHPLPVCPAEVVGDRYTEDELEEWKRRGAVNAGMSVFLYINEVANKRYDPIRYDECENIGK